MGADFGVSIGEIDGEDIWIQPNSNKYRISFRVNKPNTPWFHFNTLDTDSGLPIGTPTDDGVMIIDENGEDILISYRDYITKYKHLAKPGYGSF